ncbi:MAG: hypothetical protein ACTSW1_02265 [Candidatus Hodarchaeales archaeon]
MDTKNMIKGVICTTMTDMGPYPTLNLSPLSEDTTVKLSVIGMTILSMGAGTVAEKQHYRLHGSIPIPDSSTHEALAMSFTVTPQKTNDARIGEHGRESTIWLIFDSKDRDFIFLRHGQIERTLQNAVRMLQKEQDLSDEKKLTKIFEDVKKVLAETIISEEMPITQVPKMLAEKGGLEYFTIEDEGKLLELEPNQDFSSHPILILVNSVLKKILVIKLQDNIPQRLLFLAGRSASNLNSNRFKNEYNIRNVLDPLEREMILEKIGLIQEIAV